MTTHRGWFGKSRLEDEVSELRRELVQTARLTAELAKVTGRINDRLAVLELSARTRI